MAYNNYVFMSKLFRVCVHVVSFSILGDTGIVKGNIILPQFVNVNIYQYKSWYILEQERVLICGLQLIFLQQK